MNERFLWCSRWLFMYVMVLSTTDWLTENAA